jgi:uncharacterized tellurite resistance protein B-like protein
METTSYDKLLLKTAFCCMASDGHIDEREIALVKSMCEQSPLFKDFNFQEEINALVQAVNQHGKQFISEYFALLNSSTLSEQEELTLIDFAIQTINADQQIEYSEIKFFKNIRHRLKVGDETILKHFPDFEQYLEDDIITDSYLDKIAAQYLEISELPQFDLISVTNSSQAETDKP